MSAHTDSAIRPAPLHGMRVLDLTRLLPGPLATQHLADYGAEVIKVEDTGAGDYARTMGAMNGDTSYFYQVVNRNKRSLRLDLKQPEGRALFLRLVETADVVVEGFRPGVMDKLGLGYEVLAAANPAIVCCSISGYGQSGPYSQRAGHDINYIGYAGVLDMIGERGRGPVVPGVQIGDIGGGGLMAAVGILAALAEREKTGRGRFVDISMTDGAFSWMSIHGQAFAMTGEVPRRGAMRLAGEFACYHVYRCADERWVTVGALEPQFWEALCQALGVPEMIERQFSPPEEQDLMIARLAEIFATRTRDAWVADLADLDACFGPVKDMEEAFADEQLLARGMVVEAPTPEGTVHAIGNPVHLVGDERPSPRPAPDFGEHTDDVLRAAGYDDARIEQLRATRAI